MLNNFKRTFSTIKPKSTFFPNCLKCTNAIIINSSNTKEVKCKKYVKYNEIENFIAENNNYKYENCIDVRKDTNKCGIEAKDFNKNKHLITYPIISLCCPPIIMFACTKYTMNTSYIFLANGSISDIYAYSIIAPSSLLCTFGICTYWIFKDIEECIKIADIPNMIEINEK